jgi:(p)ppGpp synthase/HD superfamily hydrolase
MKETLRETDFDEFDREYHDVHEYAEEKHSGQFRKASGKPYITHPVAVAKLIKAYGGSDDLVRAAELHDTIEDTGSTWDDIASRFGEKVADVVTELTNDREAIEELGKENYMSRHILELSDDALFIKLADCLHNSLDRPRPSQLERMKVNIKTLLRNRRLRGNLRELALEILSI